MIRKFWHSTFGLVALVGCLFAVATLIAGALAADITHHALEIQLNQRIALEAHALIDEGAARGTAGLAAAIERRDAARSTASLDYLLVDRAGRRIAGSMELHAPIRLGYYEFLHYRQGRARRVGQSLTMAVKDGNILIIAADRTVIHDMDATLRGMFRVAFGVLLLLGVAAAWLVGAVTRARLGQIDEAAQAIIDGNLSQRMPLKGTDDEFDRVSRTLNRMLDRIGGLMDNLRQMSSDVAHDLRTPLTRLHNHLEDATSSTDPAAQREAIDAASAQSRELLDIFASLLRIAELEALPGRSQFRTIALGMLVEEMLDTYRPDLEARGHVIHATIAPDVLIVGERRLLQQVVTNLLDNVLRHTPLETVVHIAVVRDAAAARLTVRDEGPGVAPEDAARLFQRFARGERSRSTEGHGLGLALVAAIAGAHHGTAALAEPPGFGVIVTLPIAA